MASSVRTGLAVSGESIYGSHEDNYWRVMLNDIRQALEAAGGRLDVVGPTVEEVLRGETPPYVILFNFKPKLFVGKEDRQTHVGSFWRNAPTRLIGLCIDHALNVLEPLLELQQAARANPKLPPRYVGVMEQSHIDFLKAFGFDTSRSFVFAQAGPPPNPARLPIADRDVDIIGSGSLNDLTPDHEHWAEILGSSDAGTIKLFERITDQVIDGDADIHEMVHPELQKAGINLSSEIYVAVLRAIDRRARDIRRHRMLELVKGFDVRFYGNASEKVRQQLPHISFHEPVSFARLVELYGNAKVAINDTINLRESALVRMFYAMAEGCVVASQPNAFLDREFISGRGYVPLSNSRPDGLELLRRCIEAPAEGQAIAEHGLSVYERGHTWGHRIEPLLRVIGECG